MAASTLTKFFKNFFLILLWLITTAAASLICFYGMSFITSIVFLATIAFLINFAVEGEVYRQTIIEGLKRLSTRYTKHEMVRTFLLDLLKSKDKGFWLETYKNTLIKRLGDGEEHLNDDEIKKIDILEAAALLYIENPNINYEAYEKLAGDLKQRAIKKDVFNELTALIDQDEKKRKKDVLADINGTIWKVRLNLFLSFCAGFVMALVGVLSLQAAANAFSFLSFLTLPYILAISAVATIGFTLMYYGTVAKFIQKSSWSKLKDAWRWFCHGNENDSGNSLWDWTKFILGRIAIVIIILAFVIFSNMITAACWRGASEEGLSDFAGDSYAVYISSYILVGLMFLPIMIYGLSTTLNTLEKWFGVGKKEESKQEQIKYQEEEEKTKLIASASDNKQEQKDVQILDNHFSADSKEPNSPEVKQGNTQANTPIEDPSYTWWANPFRWVDSLLTYTVFYILFFGHIFAAGLMADSWGPLPVILCIIIGGLADGISDAGFMPKPNKRNDTNTTKKEGEEHSHTSTLLMIMASPINLVICIVRILAVVVDVVFFTQDLSKSLKKIQPLGAFRFDAKEEKHEEISREQMQAIDRQMLAPQSSGNVSSETERLIENKDRSNDTTHPTMISGDSFSSTSATPVVAARA